MFQHNAILLAFGKMSMLLMPHGRINKGEMGMKITFKVLKCCNLMSNSQVSETIDYGICMWDEDGPRNINCTRRLMLT